MLHDSRWDVPFEIPTTSPTWDSFRAFVTMKAKADPEGGYDWSNCRACAVGQYLTMNGIYHEHWRGDPLLAQMDDLAEGGCWRTTRGRFTNDPEKVMVGRQWTWGALAKRLGDGSLSS